MVNLKPTINYNNTAVVWDWPVIQKIMHGLFPKWCCLLFLWARTLLTLLQSTQLYNCGIWGNSSSCVSLSKKLHSHCSSLPSSNGYLAVLALAGDGKSWTYMKLLHVDAAIQGKLIIPLPLALLYTQLNCIATVSDSEIHSEIPSCIKDSERY